jgi:hypothetical protein
LFRAGKEALARGELDKACASYAESQQLDPAPGTLLNLADCEEKRGRLASAWERFVQARAALPPRDARVKYADRRVADLEGRLPRLAIVVAPNAPSDTEIVRDDIVVGKASLEVATPVDPGAHVVVARAPGRVDARFAVTLVPGQRLVVTVEPGASTVRDEPAAPPRPLAASEPVIVRASPPLEPERGSRTVGWALLGVGAVGLTVGAVAGILTVSAADRVRAECRADGRCTEAGLDASSRGQTFEIVSPIALGVGAVAAGAGVWLLLTGRARPSSGVAVAPLVGPDGAGFGARGAF